MSKNFIINNMKVTISDSSELSGNEAANFVATRLREAITKNGKANLILATGASQFNFLKSFKSDNSVDWSKITVFHLDEYKDMSDQHSASFRKYLRERILDEVKPARVFLLGGDADNTEAETIRYENLLRLNKVDVGCIGIGENGHIAFNDPAVADFNDPRLVKVVELDELCRKQQLGEGWFKSLDEVPTHALSLTIPAIMNCRTISCVVPDSRKAEAVYNTINGPIEISCPASILRKHNDTKLFLDRSSAMRLNL